MADLFGYDHYERLSRSAEISECGRYRWWLRRSWLHGGNGKVVCFIMLNPSTADALIDDPTIRRCIGFVKSWGYSTLSVRNLFALRATDPKELLTADNPTGGQRGDGELCASLTANLVVVAWGADVPFGRDGWFLKTVAKTFPLYCLRVTKNGSPQHPLYCRADLQPVPFNEAAKKLEESRA